MLGRGSFVAGVKGSPVERVAEGHGVWGQNWRGSAQAWCEVGAP